MKKAEQLRAHLTERISFFTDNPDRLVMFIEEARVMPVYAPNLNFEYQYTLTIGVEEFTGSPDPVTVAIIEFMQINQRDVLQNADLAKDAITLNAEFLDHDRYDLMYKITLRETVIASLGTDGNYTINHMPAPLDIDQLPVQFAGVRDDLSQLDWSPEAMTALKFGQQP